MLNSKSLFFLLAASIGIPAYSQVEAELFQTHCAVCHGSDRLGVSGPALLPENLRRVRKKQAASSIANGLPATQMPAFSGVLQPEEIASLVEFIYTPLAKTPAWDEQTIRRSHRVLNPELVEGTAKSSRPVYEADPLNVFLVVEAGDHHVSVLDG
ncbi:MAG: c-type cytochrome, partial [Gammaproteobacteria bacterium]|nr:c-type cytochrome [Gammaproteobacteria bacterium]